VPRQDTHLAYPRPEGGKGVDVTPLSTPRPMGAVRAHTPWWRTL